MKSHKEGPLYVRLAQALHAQIDRQVWQPGERLPSVRQLARQHGVSMGTAFQVYYYLEDHGVLEARPRLGYFVRKRTTLDARLPRPSESAATGSAVVISQRLGTVLSVQTAVARHPLPSAAVLNPALTPAGRLHKAVRQGLSVGSGISYEHPAGFEPLRRQIAQQAARWGGTFTADDLVITSGCLEALNLCLRAVAQPGDTVAVESPTYYGVLQSLENMGLKALEIATDPQTGVDLTALAEALEGQPVAACLFVPNFNNPLGSCMPDAHKQQLVALLTRWQIPLIEDDVYGELYFGPTRPTACRPSTTTGGYCCARPSPSSWPPATAWAGRRCPHVSGRGSSN